MDNMQRLTDEQSQAFWFTAGRLKERQILVETEQEFKNRMAAFNLFDSVAAFIGQAAATIFKAFNTGIKSKVSQLSSAFDIGDIDEGIPPISGKVKFMTAGDSKVCPNICGPLEGNIYNADDIDIPSPPDDTHLHCRCRLIPLLSTEE